MRTFRRYFEQLRRHPSTLLRRSVAIALIVGGVLGFLPVLGFWLLPLGLLLLSDDIPWLRRWRRQQTVRWGRWWARHKERRLSGSGWFRR